MSDARIRSYVLRQVRLTRLQQEAFVLHAPRLLVPYRRGPVDMPEEFANRHGIRPHRVTMEIGFGMGEATIELARNNPETCYLGVEVHKPGVGKVLSEIEANCLSNLLVAYYDVVPVLRDMIPRRSLEGAHVFFPDPWPKKKHHKRRLVQPAFARLLATRIAANGYVYAVTDWEEYAHQMLEVFGQVPGLRNGFEGFAHDIPWRPTTSFERKGRAKDHKIFELYFEKPA